MRIYKDSDEGRVREVLQSSLFTPSPFSFLYFSLLLHVIVFTAQRGTRAPPPPLVTPVATPFVWLWKRLQIVNSVSIQWTPNWSQIGIVVTFVKTWQRPLSLPLDRENFCNYYPGVIDCVGHVHDARALILLKVEENFRNSCYSNRDGNIIWKSRVYEHRKYSWPKVWWTMSQHSYLHWCPQSWNNFS